MKRAMFAAAIVQVLVGVAALILGHLIVILTAVFATLWLVSSALFQHAARKQV